MLKDTKTVHVHNPVKIKRKHVVVVSEPETMEYKVSLLAENIVFPLRAIPKTGLVHHLICSLIYNTCVRVKDPHSPDS